MKQLFSLFFPPYRRIYLIKYQIILNLKQFSGCQIFILKFIFILA